MWTFCAGLFMEETDDIIIIIIYCHCHQSRGPNNNDFDFLSALQRKVEQQPSYRIVMFFITY